MNSKKAKKLRRVAETQTIGLGKDLTDKFYKQLKEAYKNYKKER